MAVPLSPTHRSVGADPGFGCSHDSTASGYGARTVAPFSRSMLVTIARGRAGRRMLRNRNTTKTNPQHSYDTISP